MERKIIIKGAREHNLKNISLSIPRDKLVVLTGLSGSGKSSLAFDTIYAEGQRRYLESLSAYARQFLEQMKKPDVDSIEGLSPSISIEQKNISRNPRSTVGTVTEIYDYLRLLYARVGTPHCFSCGKPIRTQTIQQIVDKIMEGTQGRKFAVRAPIARGKKGEYQKELMELRAQGFVRARIDGAEVSLSEPIKLKKSLKHDISIYVDRLVLKTGIETRLADSLEIAVKLSEGLIDIDYFGEEKARLYSTKFACADCGTSFPEVEPRNFSFNSPHGACATCSGLGTEPYFDPALVVPNPKLSLREGAIAPWAGKSKNWQSRVFDPLVAKFKFNLDTPFEKLPQKVQDTLLFGAGKEEVDFKSGSHSFKQKFEGVIPSLKAKLEESTSFDEYELEPFLSYRGCEVCKGTRLKAEMLSVFIGGKNIADYCSLNINAAREFLNGLTLTRSQELISQPITKEIDSRLSFLINVGLSYLSLSRSANTLSGGEAQRIRLATQIGSNLVGVLYILDEPSIGLHQRDNDKLIRTLEQLRDQGNSVLVVEHDEETIERADFVVDLGPGAGEHGGEIVFQGPPGDLRKSPKSLTGQYLSGKLAIPVPTERRRANPDRMLRLIHATQNNLKNLDVTIPLGMIVGVTGVSGSGKSTLVNDTLLVALEHQLAGRKIPTSLGVEKIEGLEHLDKVVFVDQSPIGRTPRSNPATYTGVFTEIRTLFSELPEAKVRGYSPSRFSFNVGGGRCEACSGDGTLKISMHFLPDVYVECEVCRGKRYNRETLEVLYRGKSIHDVLTMTIEHAIQFFERVPALKGKLQTLMDVGLDYIRLGQSAVTLSGGEAQRIKLAKELTKRATGRTLYILDEPTTGLHFEDVRKLLQILQALVATGNSLIIIEHNLDVMKQADYLIDLGPEGGDAGGYLLFEGTPEELAKQNSSHTGKYLAKALGRRPSASTGRAKANLELSEK